MSTFPDPIFGRYPNIIKYALAYLAASVDIVKEEGMSDEAADVYRALWGEDIGERTFALDRFLRPTPRPPGHIPASEVYPAHPFWPIAWVERVDRKLAELENSLHDVMDTVSDKADDASVNAYETRVRDLENEIGDLENEIGELKSEVRGEG